MVGSNMPKNIAELHFDYQSFICLRADINDLIRRIESLEGAARGPPESEGLLSQEEAAAKIGVKPPTMAAWRHFGKGPRFIKVGRSCFYRQSDIETWLDEQAVVPALTVTQTQKGTHP